MKFIQDELLMGWGVRNLTVNPLPLVENFEQPDQPRGCLAHVQQHWLQPKLQNHHF